MELWRLPARGQSAALRLFSGDARIAAAGSNNGRSLAGDLPAAAADGGQCVTRWVGTIDEGEPHYHEENVADDGSVSESTPGDSAFQCMAGASGASHEPGGFCWSIDLLNAAYPADANVTAAEAIMAIDRMVEHLNETAAPGEAPVEHGISWRVETVCDEAAR